MRYLGAFLALVLMGAVFPSGHRQDRHTTLVVEQSGRLYDDGWSSYAYEYTVPELAAYTYDVGNGQEFRRFHYCEVWLLTRACLREWVFVPAGEHVLNVTVSADRAGYVPPSAYAVCHVGTNAVGNAPPSDIGVEPFGLAGETPRAYGRKIAVTGPVWVVVSISTETIMPNEIWPQGERYPFAVQLGLNACID